ncbi:MAG: hypothetical protein ACFFCW_31750 [Candidatus Hodarchaeota archaeon]
MSDHLRFDKILRLAVFVIAMFLLLPGSVYTKIIPKNTEVDILRFDAILELDAPLAGTHVMLCARNWISPKYYSVAVVWAEPHVSSLNFPTYPITLKIHSDEQKFSLSNQIRTRNDATFSKPLGQRGVFRHKLNNYPIADIRFAEPEALASRIYTSDLEKFMVQTENVWQTIDVRNSMNERDIDREVTKLNLRTTDGHIDALNLMDANDQLIKSIEYEYSRHKGLHMIRKQNVLLPEKLMMVGYKGRGATIKINDIERTYKELPGSHHRGGRKCTIEYEPVKVGKRLLPLPVRITVRQSETNAILRTAQMYNFVQLKHSTEEAKQVAARFVRLDEKELKVKELLTKYWLKDPDEIEDTDVNVLKQLRTHFENYPVIGKTVGEKLKRINMLLELDWIQSDPALQKHFKQYIDILTENDLNHMILVGGLHIIDTTIKWGQFPAADKLLQEWIDNVISACNAETILGFGQIQIRKRNYWTIATLFGECSKPYLNWDQKLFDAHALRFISLYELYEIIKDPSKAKINRAITQAGWASWSTGTDNLLKMMNESIAEAQKAFANLDSPTSRQKALKKQLDKISQK